MIFKITAAHLRSGDWWLRKDSSGAGAGASGSIRTVTEREGSGSGMT